MTKKVSLDLKKRLSKEDALDLIKNASLLDLAKMATEKKDELHKEKLTTFIVDRNINYTNVCWVDCKFCAFFRHKKDSDSYVLKFDEIDEKIEELLAIGGTQILFQGGVHPNLKIDYYEELVNHIHTKYPQITIHGFSSIEIDFIAKVSKISILEVLKRLQAKGLSSIYQKTKYIVG
jgi:cyclic dehypoxanthinyl futalosine synthase